MKPVGIRVVLAGLSLALGCQQAATEESAPAQDAITSNDGSSLELAFAGVVVTRADTSAKDAALSQLEYLQGVLTTDVNGNAQFGHAKLENVVEKTEAGAKRVTFTATVPVIWPKGTQAPTEYAFALPLDTRKLSDFNAKYDGKCGTNQYGRETFWHDFNPKAKGCQLAADDVTRATATVRTHPRASKDTYLEYDRVWADDRLDVVGVFGILSSFTDSDGGVKEFNALVAEAERGLTNETIEELAPGATVLRATRVTGQKTINGKKRAISVTAILVHSVSGAGADFDELYEPASETADFIYYGGHSGLGANIRSLADRARVVTGKYQVVYLNGCQTFGYLGTAWNDKKRDANGKQQDPEGTKDLDVFVTGLPAFDDSARSMLSIYRALETVETPKTINQILEDFSSFHLNVVFGEDDNRFRPR
jgi:hypothetical protein